MGQGAPVNGMRPAEARLRAIVNATVVPEPGRRLENATIVIDDGLIVAVGSDIDVPPGAHVTDARGLTVYPGLIESALLVPLGGVATVSVEGGGAHWNQRVHPQVSVAELPPLDAAQRTALREQGFAVAAIYPDSGIFRGSGAVQSLAEQTEHIRTYAGRGAMAMAIEHGGRRESATYPSALIGAMALLRQTLLDAQWHADSEAVHRAHPTAVEPPARNDALSALARLIDGTQPALIAVRDEHDALRAAELIEEFGLRAMLLGSGLEFRRVDEIAATGLPIITPLDFPAVPEVNDTRQSEGVSLAALINWEQAPTNPRRLVGAGVPVALTTHGLSSRGEFWGALRLAMVQGLDADAALAALTTVPAQMLGIDSMVGTIEPGKAAHLVIVQGELFVRRPTIRSVWIHGRPTDVRPSATAALGLATVGPLGLRIGRGGPFPVTLEPEENRLSIRVAADQIVRATRVAFTRDRVAFVIDGEPFEVDGSLRCVGIVTGGTLIGDAETVGGRRFGMVIEALADGLGLGDPPPIPERTDDEAVRPVAPDIALRPLGDGGVAELPTRGALLLEGGTIWTSGPQGVISPGWILLRDGRIEAIGEGEQAPVARRLLPEEGLNLDVRGRHVTPGLIDCHSHTGIRGGVNEWTKASTAEVRIADAIDPDDVNWHRQLAGGLTTVNQLHGSANPIGGQNSVVKIRWGEPASRFPIDADGRSAPGGIKFALGENVVRTRTRYPNTRMGVEAFLRDRFVAAREMRDAFDRYAQMSDAERARTLPPRRDLELEALVEVLEGTRLVHCHSYRQDEILMFLRLAEEFGFRVGTLQHILEGYKVGEVLASHGAGASSFSDWWGYKVEVMDAIPDNGAILHRLGVLVSFNSDSNEVARRMNTEASKAIRFGELEPEEALALVTINPARQLAIDDRVGSLEVGKDADVVIWNGHPLSTMSRCEMTIVDGVFRFDRDANTALREALVQERARLVALAAGSGERERQRRRQDQRDEEAREEGVPETMPDRRPLLARMLDSRVDALLAMVRNGQDPEEIRPGECGCGAVTLLLNDLVDDRPVPVKKGSR